MTDVIQALPTIERIYAPKRSCPRDLGYWYCDGCIRTHYEEVSELDFPIPLIGCHGKFGDKVCGLTHLGYEWCNECKTKGRIKPHNHFNEYVIVGLIEEKLE